MMKIKIIGILGCIAVLAGPLQGKTPFELRSGQPVKVACAASEEKVVHTALQLFERDYRAVFSAPVTKDARQGNIVVGTLGESPLLESAGADLSPLEGKKEAFLLTVLPDGRLLVAGSDKRGTAYGILEFSRLIGVSPWEWWADAVPAKKESFKLSSGFRTVQSPSVEYRGIFINDEDWGLLPWSNRTYEPSEARNVIGPRTNERIFELLLRLRANTYWPAMHECTLPYFLTKGNKEVAEAYGIYIGSSHCEPMVSSAAGEWSRRGEGEYDYVNNSRAVYRFWEERVKEVGGQDNLYTLGMRGVHDGQMKGARTIEEQKAVLARVIREQRELLKEYVDKDVTRVPQVFIPYKEVLDIYNAGLEVPGDVTLMWCDDNYGYIHHFPTEQERARKGGNGVYYHVSYWGRPHDYLWLGTANPALIYQQMSLAYEKGIRKVWILNVGDIKPAEYQIELFMDMAWDFEEVRKKGVKAHQYAFLEREFGKKAARSLQPLMQEYYRLAHIRKPEFMGNTREEEKNPAYKVIKDLPWSESYIRQRMQAYRELSEQAEQLVAQIPPQQQDAYFQLVQYPVQASCQMNRKLLTAQLARHGKADWAESDAAFDSIAALTRIYNKGKWNRIMDFQPRRLPVFERVKRETSTLPMSEERQPFYLWNGMDCKKGTPIPYEALGYEGKAAGIGKGTSLTFGFFAVKADSVTVEVRLLPNHPVDGDQLRFSVSLDGSTPQVVSYETVGRSEEWKENVLRNQAIRRLTLPLSPIGKHRLTLTALDEGVILDQVALY